MTKYNQQRAHNKGINQGKLVGGCGGSACTVELFGSGEKPYPNTGSSAQTHGNDVGKPIEVACDTVCRKLIDTYTANQHANG